MVLVDSQEKQRFAIHVLDWVGLGVAAAAVVVVNCCHYRWCCSRFSFFVHRCCLSWWRLFSHSCSCSCSATLMLLVLLWCSFRVWKACSTCRRPGRLNENSQTHGLKAFPEEHDWPQIGSFQIYGKPLDLNLMYFSCAQTCSPQKDT